VMTTGGPLSTPRRNSWVVTVTLWKAILPVPPSASVFAGEAVLHAVKLPMAKRAVKTPTGMRASTSRRRWSARMGRLSFPRDGTIGEQCETSSPYQSRNHPVNDVLKPTLIDR
jgi:hypothetical protein